MKRKTDEIKIYVQLFATFFKIGLFTVGGGLAMLPLIQRIVVEEKKWMTDEEMLDCLAVCQSLPGVIAINAATYIGKRQKGIRGSLAASLGVMLPSFIVIILAVLFLKSIGENPYIQGAFTGLKAASCGLILCAAIKLGKQALRGRFAWAIAVVSFVMIAILGITAIWAILLGALSGLAAMAYQMRAGKKRGKEG